MLGVLCWRLMISAYTSGDDGYTAFAAIAEHGIWGSAKEMAIFQGRFYQLLIYPLAMLPFVFENNTVVNLFKVITFIAFIGGYASLARAMFGTRGALACTAILLCLFDTVGGNYNPFHGLPLWFGLGCGALLYSLALHIKACATGRLSHLAVFFFAVALMTYEIVLLYLPLYAFVWLYIDEAQGTSEHWLSPRRVVLSIRRAAPFTLCALVYLACYVIFRHYYPGTYVGAGGFTIAPIPEMTKPVLAFSWHSLYWHFRYPGHQGFSLLCASYVCAGLLAVIAACWPRGEIIPNTLGLASSFRVQRYVLGIMILVGYIFVPNALFALTLRYRIWAGDGVQFYLGSMFSAVPLTMLIYLAIQPILAALSRSAPRFALAIAVLAILGAYTYANSRNSQNFYIQSERMAVRWAVADWLSEVLKRPDVVTSIPANATICGRGFTHSKELYVYFRNADLLADIDLYWTRYLSRRSGRYIQYVTEDSSSQHCTAWLDLSYHRREAIFKFADGRQERFAFGAL